MIRQKWRFKLLVFLLKRYCQHDMDQWELWKFKKGKDTYFISIATNAVGGDAYAEI